MRAKKDSLRSRNVLSSVLVRTRNRPDVSGETCRQVGVYRCFKVRFGRSLQVHECRRRIEDGEGSAVTARGRPLLQGEVARRRVL